MPFQIKMKQICQFSALNSFLAEHEIILISIPLKQYEIQKAVCSLIIPYDLDVIHIFINTLPFLRKKNDSLFEKKKG